MSTHSISLCNRAIVDERLTALAKRITKRGLDGMLAWAWGDVTKKNGEYRIALALTVEVPKLPGGWTLVARLDHGEGGNVIRSVPGVEAPETYRTCRAWCDHCKRVRSRKDTFVMRSESGEYSQVGSSCIGDFLGHDATRIIQIGEALEDLDDCLGSSGGPRDFATDYFVTVVAAMVRNFGWLSGTTAREQGKAGTANFAWTVAERGLVLDTKTGEKLALEPADETTATVALEWAKALPETSEGYIGNLRVLANRGYVSARDAGLIGSVIVAHANAMEQEIKRARAAAGAALSTHIGTVGKRETFEVTVTKAIQIESAYGISIIYLMRDAAGNIAKWKTASGDLDMGETYRIKATVKAHGEYKGALQTELSRCKVEAKLSVEVAAE